MREAAVRWRHDVHRLLVSLAIAVAGYGMLLLVVAGAVAGMLGALGLLRWAVGRVRALADQQRARSGLAPGAPPQAQAPTGTPVERVRTLLSAPDTRRELLWVASPLQAGSGLLELNLAVTAAAGILMPLVHLVAPRVAVNYLGTAVVDVPTSFLVVPNGLLLAALAAWAGQPLVQAEAWQSRRLLAPTAATRLAERVDDLTRSRSTALDASAVELRRIERDLHDGAQARLVSLAMNLGMAQELLASDPEKAAALVAAARSQASTATTELRALVRGIHPPLLADRGLDGALRALAMDCPVPVELNVRLGRRLSPPVESAVYFAVVEAMTNAAKHSGARAIRLTLADSGVRLLVHVADDGCGGADPELGTGLRGIERRVAVFDGSLHVDSPNGGPTVVRVELPCAS